MSQRRAERKFVCTRRTHLVAETEDHRAWTLGCTVTAEPRCSIAHNWRNVCQRFDVINGGGLAKESGRSWIGRFRPWFGRLAFEDFERRRIFARNINGWSALNRNLQRVQIPRATRFLNRFRHSSNAVAVGFVDVKADLFGIDCSSREDRAFENQMRPMLDQRTIFETTRLIFARIADHVSRFHGCFRSGGPLLSDGKTRAATAAQAGLSDFIENFRG